MKALLMTLGLLTLPLASQAADGFFKQLTLPSGQVVTVSEGRGEPASTGSYDVRLYSGANPSSRWISSSTARCCRAMAASGAQAAGSQRRQAARAHRRGRGAGGSYLSADAFTINPQEGLDSFNHVEGLAPMKI